MNILDSQIIEIINLYNKKYTIKGISKIYKVRQSKISSILKNNNVKIRTSKHVDFVKYSLDHDYFSKIDSPEKAYFLGLLYADGNVSYKTNTISLILNDTELLDAFKLALKCDKIFYKNKNHLKATTFSFCSPKMKQDLIKLGCPPKKSLIIKFPNNKKVPKKYIYHFIRGYFDGDGSIYIGKVNQFKIISSTKFCEGLQLFFEQQNIFSKIWHEPRYKQETSYLRINRKKDLKKLRKLLYNDAAVFLTRKKNNFEKLI